VSTLGGPEQTSRGFIESLREAIEQLRNLGTATRDASRGMKEESEQRGRSVRELATESAAGFAQSRGRRAAAAAGTDLVDLATSTGVEAVLNPGAAGHALAKGAAAAGHRGAEDELDVQANAEARTLAMWEPAIRTGQISVEQAMPMMKASLGLRGGEEILGTTARRQLHAAANEMFADVDISQKGAESMTKKAYEALGKSGSNWGSGG